MNLILNFLPMVLLYLIATYSPQVARISHTVLGKVVAIGLIVLYSFFDIVSGLLVCALIIFYYQTDYVESFANEDGQEEVNEEPDDEQMEEEQTEEEQTEEEQTEEEQTEEEQQQTEEEEQTEVPDEQQEPFTTVVKNEVLIVGKIKKTQVNKVKGHKEVLSSGPGEELKYAYPLEPTITKNANDKAIADFRKKHCSKGHLMHKGQVVKPESAEHVFPELKQDDFHKCNVCDPNCRFELINNQSEKLLKAEENLIKPKSSNEFFDVVWNNIQISKSK
jgi:hypothetical protein